MINLFEASGHIHYAKSARIHLQNMLDLGTRFPRVYSCCINNGYPTVRRSDRFWAGLWSDLIIEQCLMRTLKSRGGLTHGRRVTESVRHLWISSMHRCARIHEAMGSLTNQKQRTLEQHTELGKSRISRDNKYLEEVIKWFDSHETFDPSEHNLKSISSGITAVTDEINCDNAKEVGEMIQQKLH